MNGNLFYSNIHKKIHNRIKSPRFPLKFSLISLAGSVGLLFSALLLGFCAENGHCDYHIARRLLPVIAEAAALGATLAVVGGCLLEKMRLDSTK